MKTKSTQPAKTRLEVRIDEGLKKRAMAASQMDSTDLSALVIRGLNREIEDIYQRHKVIHLGLDEYQDFLALAEESRPLSPILQRAAERRKERGFSFDHGSNN